MSQSSVDQHGVVQKFWEALESRGQHGEFSALGASSVLRVIRIRRLLRQLKSLFAVFQPFLPVDYMVNWWVERCKISAVYFQIQKRRWTPLLLYIKDHSSRNPTDCHILGCSRLTTLFITFCQVTLSIYTSLEIMLSKQELHLNVIIF